MMTPIETRFRALNGKLQELLAYEQKLSRQRHAAAGDTFNLVIRSFLATLAVAIAGTDHPPGGWGFKDF